jgi:hypothetical protein
MAFRSTYARSLSGPVGHVDPEKRQVPEILAYSTLQLEFVESALSAGAAPLSPLRVSVVKSATLDERLPDALSEHGASVVAAALVRAAQRASMSPEAVPQRGATPRRRECRRGLVGVGRRRLDVGRD